MDREVLIKVLQLDSLIGFLSWQERAEIHHYKESDTISSKKTLAAFVWIIKEKWESPDTKYGQDRILYFYDPDSDTWITDEYYLKLYPEYKEELTKLKYY